MVIQPVTVTLSQPSESNRGLHQILEQQLVAWVLHWPQTHIANGHDSKDQDHQQLINSLVPLG